MNGRLKQVNREYKGTVSPESYLYYYDLAGRLARRLDSRGQTTRYRYNLSDQLVAIAHENAVEPTPDTHIVYDPMRGRIDAIEDKLIGVSTGRIDYIYHPITAPTGTLGAGQLASVSGPLSLSTATFGYDELGRLVARTLPGQSENWVFDALGRVSSTTNSLGEFIPAYDGATARVTGVTRTGGLSVSVGYDPIDGDRGLAQVTTRKPNNAMVAGFVYTNDPVRGLLKQVQEIRADGSDAVWHFDYTNADELEAAWRTESVGPASPLQPDFSFVYDPSGNLLGRQAGSSVSKWTLGDHNRPQTRKAGGWARFMFTLPSAPVGGKILIGDKAALVDASGAARRFVAVVPGTNDVNVTAIVPGEAAVLKRTVQMTVVEDDTLDYEHDDNGNLTAIKRDGAVEAFYRYDARDRLVAWGTGSLVAGRFVYDPLGRISKETSDAGALREGFVWHGAQLAQTRLANNSVKTHLFAQGQVNETGTNPGNRYYARDRQGSVQAVLDGSGQIVSSYVYDPYGQRVRKSGTETHDIGYQGAFSHESTGLLLNATGAFNPELGRWMTPVADDAPRYAFGGNAPPSSGGDPFGLMASGLYPSNSDDEFLGAVGVAQMLGSTAAGLIGEQILRNRDRERGRSGSGSCNIGNGASKGTTGSGGPAAARTVTNLRTISAVDANAPFVARAFQMKL